ncbi:hypothetical protein Nepgr_027678 [Nepenthes gracilis]|uniref:Uncharacterized protein n=1 Tax=Nepenthes gracilis TaxID=150966 RepID=A0AAD3T8Z1_NEPGR|nr:hypothetical protein Nepgr_027678 [Nepenthes gracilis]
MDVCITTTDQMDKEAYRHLTLMVIRKSLVSSTRNFSSFLLSPWQPGGKNTKQSQLLQIMEIPCLYVQKVLCGLTGGAIG